MKLTSIQELIELHKKYSKNLGKEKKTVSVCGGTGCRASRALEVVSAFKEVLNNGTPETEVILKETGCHGLCEKGPLVVIRPENIFYQMVKPENVPEIVDKTLIHGEIIESLLYQMPDSEEKIIKEDDVPFYKWQKRLVFGNNGYIQGWSYYQCRPYPYQEGWGSIPGVWRRQLQYSPFL